MNHKEKIEINVENSSKIIPVVFATSKNYILQTYVSLLSVLDNKKDETQYDFYILVPKIPSIFIENEFKKLINKYGNCKIHFIKMGKLFSELKNKIAHLSIQTYYRLKITEILPKEYKKAIYLDSDTLVLKDLTEFFNYNLENNYIGGVIAAGYIISKTNRCYYKVLGLKDLSNYINSGVTLWNTDEIRKNNIIPELLELAKKNLASEDQDVINIVFQNKIKILPYKYNMMTSHWNILLQRNTGSEKIRDRAKKLEEIYGTKNIEEAINKPTIIHYAGNIKPWNDNNSFKAMYWIEYAKKAPFILKVNLYKASTKIKKDTNMIKSQLEVWFNGRISGKHNIDLPKTFNEKIQYLKLYDSTPLKTQLADKYLVRKWVKNKIGDKYLIPLYGCYDKFEEIDFDLLPNQFVIKCNHGCRYNIIVKDKKSLNYNEVKEKINSYLDEDYAYRWGYELHYSNIKRKIIIEKYLENKNTNELYDYKFWCFNGKVHYIQFLSGRNSNNLKMAFYNRKWKKQKFCYNFPILEEEINKPSNLELMIKLAEKLSKGFSHVRVDFYNLNDSSIYFGEMTFTTASGACIWNKRKYDLILGRKIKLPKVLYDYSKKTYCNSTKHFFNILKENLKNSISLS